MKTTREVVPRGSGKHEARKEVRIRKQEGRKDFKGRDRNNYESGKRRETVN